MVADRVAIEEFLLHTIRRLLPWDNYRMLLSLDLVIVGVPSSRPCAGAWYTNRPVPVERKSPYVVDPNTTIVPCQGADRHGPLWSPQESPKPDGQGPRPHRFTVQSYRLEYLRVKLSACSAGSAHIHPESRHERAEAAPKTREVIWRKCFRTRKGPSNTRTRYLICTSTAVLFRATLSSSASTRLVISSVPGLPLTSSV